MKSKRHNQVLYAILIIYLVIATMTSVVTPIFEIYDEVWHYPLVEHLATHDLALPKQDPAVISPWRQEGSQPPLYYMAAAILTAWIDTSDMAQLHRQNPLPQAGITAPDGNPNIIVHRTELETFPWQGTTLAVHIVRFFSIMLGLATILVTYQMAKEIFPDNEAIQLGATALNAFLPMFILISASVNNDALSNLLANLLLLQIIRLIKTKDLPHWRTYLWIGIVTGMGLLAKLSVGLLIPIIMLALAYTSIRRRNWRPFIVGGVISGGLTIIIAGWWYYRNWELYGDPTGLNTFLDIVGRRDPKPTLEQLWSERFSVLKTYWGAYGSINVLLPERIYSIFYLIGGAAFIGTITYFIRVLKQKNWHTQSTLTGALIIVWPILAMLGLIQWTIETPASQGRLLFIAISALSLWMAIGLIWWLPKRFQVVLITLVSGFFILVALLAPPFLVHPAFAVPKDIILPGEPVTIFSAQDGNGTIALSAPQLLTTTAQPGDFIDIEMVWQITETTSIDWTLYAHLITPEGVIAGQRDVYPGRGLLATSDLPSGRTWKNPMSIRVPTTAYTPNTLMVVVGWYRLDTGERMELPNGDTTFPMGQVELTASNNKLDVPNPMRINFGDELELVGYEMSTLSPVAGDTMELTLYWRGLRQMERDYVVFANVIDMDTLTKYAASNAMPAAWTAPTSTWQPGEIIIDRHPLTIDPNAPADIFEVEIGLYIQDEAGAFNRLRIVPDIGSLADNFLQLSPVRILPADQEE